MTKFLKLQFPLYYCCLNFGPALILTSFQITELLPGILNQLGAESLTHLKKLASNVSAGDSSAAGADKDGDKDEDDKKKEVKDDDDEDDDDDDVPDLVENFDEASKGEGIVQGK